MQNIEIECQTGSDDERITVGRGRVKNRLNCGDSSQTLLVALGTRREMRGSRR